MLDSVQGTDSPSRQETVLRSVHNLEGFLESHAEMLFQVAVKQPPPIPAILLTCFDTDAEP